MDGGEECSSYFEDRRVMGVDVGGECSSCFLMPVKSVSHG